LPRFGLNNRHFPTLLTDPSVERASVNLHIAPSQGLTGDDPAAASAQGLADRRELAFIAVERTRMPMVVTDPRQADNPIVLANKAFLDLTGYSAEETIGQNCRFLQGPETSLTSLEELRTAIAQERGATVELLNYRKDGSSFWNQLCFSPIHDDDGRLTYFFGCQLDISERRRAEDLEAVERRLLKEIDHRAMNVLAIVEGIVRLSDSTDAKRYAASVQGRVRALSRAHTLLAGHGWRTVPLIQLIESQVGPYGADRVVLNGPEVAVPAQIVQPLALVLHELAMNAASYGALSASTGVVTMDWGEEPTNQHFRLLWREVGGPPPAMVRTEGFGETMIKAIVKRQLRGDVRQDWLTDGLQTEISIPLAVPTPAADRVTAP
jgi:PAS domain S-box-containing protein